MKTECSHCGHGFETADDLAACPQCEQISQTQPANPPRFIATKVSDADRFKGQAIAVAGVLLILVGLVVLPFGLLLVALGVFVLKTGAAIIDCH